MTNFGKTMQNMLTVQRNSSSRASAKISPVGAFPRKKWVPLINRHMGLVYDVTHCYNLEKKVPSSILIKCLRAY